MALKPSAEDYGCFNLDNGSGKIRGVSLQGHEAMRALRAMARPFRNLGVGTITIRNTGGADGLVARVGLPGFQVIQIHSIMVLSRTTPAQIA